MSLSHTSPTERRDEVSGAGLRAAVLRGEGLEAHKKCGSVCDRGRQEPEKDKCFGVVVCGCVWQAQGGREYREERWRERGRAKFQLEGLHFQKAEEFSQAGYFEGRTLRK